MDINDFSTEMKDKSNLIFDVIKKGTKDNQTPASPLTRLVNLDTSLF